MLRMKKRAISFLLTASMIVFVTGFFTFDFHASHAQAANLSIFNFSDPLNDFTQVYSRQNNIQLDTASAALYFEGDSSRLTRTNTNAGSFTYNRGKISGFSIKTYYNGSLGTINVYTSREGSNWTSIPYATDTPVSTGSSWYRTNLTPNAPIPYNTNYLKIEIVTSGNGQVWGTQIAQVNLKTEGMGLNFFDDLDDYSKVYSQSSNMNLDIAGSADYFENDASRAVKIDNNPGNMVYHQNNSIGFDIKVYYHGASVGDLNIYTSPDGTVWTPQTYSASVPVSTNSSTAWHRTNLTPTSPLPPNTNYLKIEIIATDNGLSWGTQIAEVRLAVINYTDNLNDLTKTYMSTSNIGLDTSSAALYFEGDTSRATRSDNNTGSFIYYKHDIASFNIKTYYNGSLGTLNIYTSRDGGKWVKQPYLIDAPVHTSSSWYRTYLSPDGKLPSETNFIKIEIVSAGNGQSWGTEIGQVNLAISEFNDELNNLDFTYAHSANVQFDVSGASDYFEGDPVRLSRANSNSAFVTYNKNNMTDFAIKTYYSGTLGSLNLYRSTDGVTWTSIAYTQAFTVPTGWGWYRTYLKPAAALPSSTHYLKIEIAGSGNGLAWGTQIGNVSIQAFNDPVAEINTILQQKGKVFKEVVGSTHVAGTYHLTTTNFLNEGADQLKNLGTDVIKVYMDMITYADNNGVPAYQARYYNWNSNWGVMSTLTQLAQHSYFVDLFNKPFKTYVITTLQPDTIDIHAQLSAPAMAAALQTEYDQIYNLTVHLLNTYRNTGKTFILQNWESDWMIQGPNGTSNQAISNMIQWMNKRQDAVNQARIDVQPQGVNVYNAIEVNAVVAGMQGSVSAVNNIVPYTYTDLYSYSAYDSTYDQHSFKAALDYFKTKAPDSAAFGNNNVYVGEIGRPEMIYGDRNTFGNILTNIKVALQNDVPYILFWQLYDNHSSVVNSNNLYDHAGFWLIKPTGEKSILWPTLQQLMK
ncbi:hypothetical protein [Paenibacillus agaridevorans]|uniref:hypothetical protein n=1 Tax=Paenibacillus agaridevorans TaxID=171404 RepID=UPI001BE480DD|nr:hypothetical protein [Paenibacillus agaridevorans]